MGALAASCVTYPAVPAAARGRRRERLAGSVGMHRSILGRAEAPPCSPVCGPSNLPIPGTSGSSQGEAAG